MAFSVGTQNLYHYNTRLDERAQHLETELNTNGIPDIVGFQEACRWINAKHLFSRFVALTKYSGIYQNTNEFLVMNDGVALVSKLPHRNLQSIWLPATKTLSKQAINIGIFAVGGGDVAVINAHLSPSSEGRARRVEQAKFILNFISQIKLPVIIVGDLNAGYAEESTQAFVQAGFHDVLEGGGATYVPGVNPLVTDSRYGPSRLDYIFYRPNELRLKSASLMFTQNWISDHYGVRADFEIVK